jgi:hypothetical protein
LIFGVALCYEANLTKPFALSMSCKNIMILSATPSHIQKAAARIQAGDIVAFPTETIYGLGADAGNADAVAKIYAAKQRPAINPLIVHCLDVDHAQDFAVFDEDALSLATQFWAGALTMILPLKQGHNLAPQVTAGLSTGDSCTVSPCGARLNCTIKMRHCRPQCQSIRPPESDYAASCGGQLGGCCGFDDFG